MLFQLPLNFAQIAFHQGTGSALCAGKYLIGPHDLFHRLLSLAPQGGGGVAGQLPQRNLLQTQLFE